MCAGPADKSSNGKGSDQQKKDEIVSCIVKFRPCEDWRGEYGFDWVREEKDVYKERFSRGLDFAFTHEEALKKFMGRRNYENWKRQKRQEILDKKAQDPDFDVDKAWQREVALEALTNHIEAPYDPHEWEKHYFEKDRPNQVKEEYTKADDPFEYLYHPKHIDYVTYQVNRARFGNIWITSEFEYDNMANGVAEAKESIGVMKSFVLVGSKKYSLIGDDSTNKFEYPIYSDIDDGQYGTWANKTKTVKSISYQHKQKNCTYEMYFWNNTSKYVLMFIYFPDDSKRCIMLKGNTLYAYEDAGHLAQKRDRLFNQGRYAYYSMLTYLTRDIADDSGWRTVNNLPTEAKNEYAHLMSEHITPNIRNNSEMDIVHLVKDEQLDNIAVKIYFPKTLKKEELTKQMGLIEKDGKYKWHKYLIQTWKENYENTFSPIKIHMKGEEEPRKYCVPILSMCEKSHRCTRFMVNNFHDAPATGPLPWNEARIQVFVEGDCQKLVFKPNMKDLIEITPSEIPNPKPKNEVTIKYLDPPDILGFKLILEAFSEREGEPQKLVGMLRVHVWDKGVLPLNVIKVVKEGSVFESNFAECIEDQMDFCTNLLAQAGVRVKRRDYTLEIKGQLSDEIMPNGDWKSGNDTDGNYAENQMLKCFKDSLRSFKETIFKDIKVFFVNSDCIEDGGVLGGYSSVENPGTIVIFKATAQGRADMCVITHEVIHALKGAHHFQRLAWSNEPYCFKAYESSNVMDYQSLGYAIHKYQWQRIQTETYNLARRH